MEIFEILLTFLFGLFFSTLGAVSSDLLGKKPVEWKICIKIGFIVSAIYTFIIYIIK